jgi:hypothetical protein
VQSLSLARVLGACHAGDQRRGGVARLSRCVKPR